MNSGHTRDAAFVIRNVGDDHEPRRFSTWGAKAIALIGRLPDTLHDRAIVIELRRKLPDEKAAKLRHAKPALFADLARQCARFAADHGEAIGTRRPQIPEALHDRAADNWEPLLSIAEEVGGEWPDVARATALALSGETDSAPTSLRVALLADIGVIFIQRDKDRISSADLIAALTALEERPWAEINHGKPITARRLAGLLSGFGISSKDIRVGEGDKNLKGYTRDQFEDAFRRYLTPSEARQRYKPATARFSADFASATETGMSRNEKPPKTAPDKACSVVADEKEYSGRADDDVADFEEF